MQIFFNKISKNTEIFSVNFCKNTEMFDKAKSIFVVLLPPDFIHF